MISVVGSRKPRYVLGVNMSMHDRSAALLRDGQLICAIAEERLDRRKKSYGFYGQNPGPTPLPPMASIRYVLAEARISLDDLDLVVCGMPDGPCRETFLKYVPVNPRRVAEPPDPGHHRAHAYSAFVTAPFEECDVLVLDQRGSRVDGHYERCSWFYPDGSVLVDGPRFWGSDSTLSIGYFYDVIATLCSLSEAEQPAAGKLMALAGFGDLRPEWRTLFELVGDGDAKLSVAAVDDFLQRDVGFQVVRGYEQFSPKSAEDIELKFGRVHWSDKLAMDLARKAQDELERAALHIVGTRQHLTNRKKLAFAGGVALNCTANARLSECGYEDVFVHPAATDDGTAVGLASYGWLEILSRRKFSGQQFTSRLGRNYSRTSGDTALQRYGLLSHAARVDPADVARSIGDGKIVCWFSGRSEWGPRALGGRSIVANPLLPDLPAQINSTIKYREWFRPFGLTVTQEDAGELLRLDASTASLGHYMLAVAEVRDDRLQSMAHVDGTLRYQVLRRNDDPCYHDLLLAMKHAVGIAAVLNTSFNVFGEPLAESPEDAVRQFLVSAADALYLDGYYIDRSSAPADVLANAEHCAFERSRLDHLKIAMQLEAAGYIYEALNHARRVTSDLRFGPERLRQLSALMMRLTAQINPTAAPEHALEVLRWSGLPKASLEAAILLSGQHADPSVASPEAARLLTMIGRPGRALPVLNGIFAKRLVDGEKP